MPAPRNKGEKVLWERLTGFLEYDRQTDPAEPPLDRIEHWKEFHPRLSEADRRQQGARCMECGVPFCQSGATLGGMTSGCPLHNLVPEWNDLLYTGQPAPGAGAAAEDQQFS